MSLNPAVRADNWAFLVGELIESDNHKAVSSRMADPQLPHLLRYHLPEGVSDPSEIQFRRQMDAWLGDAGMLYIAWICGYSSDPYESKQRRVLLSILSNPAVRQYCEKYYPIAIQWLLRLQLEGHLRLPTADSIDAAGAFERFSILYERFYPDPDLNQFLDFLDGFWYGNPQNSVNIDTVVASFGMPERVAEAFEKRSHQLTRLDRGIVGMVRFLSYSRDLDALLEGSRDFPLLQSAFWYFYGYWFREFKHHTVAEMSMLALENAMQAIQARSSIGDRDLAVASEAASELHDWERIITKLTGPDYAVRLWTEVNQVTSESIVQNDANGWLSQFAPYLEAPTERTYPPWIVHTPFVVDEVESPISDESTAINPEEARADDIATEEF